MLNGILSRVLLICNRKGAPLAAVKVEALVRLPSSVKEKNHILIPHAYRWP